MRIVLDTNVFVYRYVDPQYVQVNDRNRWKDLHSKAKTVFDWIFTGKHELIIPSIVLVEIGSIIQSLTNNEMLASKVTAEYSQLAIDRFIEIAYLNADLTSKSISFVYESKLKAVNAVIATCCFEKHATLLTNDTELYLGMISMASDPLIPYVSEAYLLSNVTVDQLNQFLDP